MLRVFRMAAFAAAAMCVCVGARADELAFANDKPIYKVGFEALAAAAQKQTGIGLRLDTYQPTDKYIAYVQASATSNSLPPLFTWWNGTNLKDIVASGRVASLDAEWAAAVKSGDFAASTAELFKVDGHIWGMPLGYSNWAVMYNRKLFAKAGIAAAPATWQEFLDDAAKLKAAGITPINSTIQSGWRAFTWFQELMLRSNPDAYRGLFTGKVAYNGPEVHEAFRLWGDLYAKGYMTDPRSTQDAVDFASGKGAMSYMGDWAIGPVENAGLTDDDIGVFVMPMINAKAQDCIIIEGGPILVAKATADQPNVKKMVSYLMSADAANVLRDTQGLYVGNLKSAPRSKLIGQLNDMVAARKAVPVTRWQEATPPELQGDLIAELGKFMLDPSPGNADKVMNNMQAINKAYWDSH
jgi:multiple sugar transport system substrate-binding protein